LVIRGAVYRVDLGKPRGHEQGGRRYGLVVSPSDMPWSVATVVPTSTSASPALFRPQFEIAGTQTVFLTDQVRSIDTNYIFDMVALLSLSELATVERALTRYLGLVASG
jgi:mRNA interferase MazF